MCERQITGVCRIRQQSEMSNLKECMKENLDTFFSTDLDYSILLKITISKQCKAQVTAIRVPK